MDRKSYRPEGAGLLAGLAAVAALGGCGLQRESTVELDYPEALRLQQEDEYFGVAVADPYRWLEVIDAAETESWIDAQNELTQRYIRDLPGRDRFADRLAALIDYQRFGLPQQRSGVYVFEHNTGLQEQDVLRVSRDPAALGRVLIDPNELSEDGSVSLAGWSLSPDGRWLAYGLSEGGSDWDYWQIRNVATGQDLPERLEGMKFSGVSWMPDSTGFYYSRYPEGDSGYDDSRQVRVYLHRLRSEQTLDRLVYEVTDHPTRNPYARVSDDGRFLLIGLFDGYETSGLYYQRLSDGLPDGRVVRLLDDWDARYEFVGNLGERFFVLTTRDAPRGRVVAIDLEAPAPSSWREVVPESDEAIESVAHIGGRLFVQTISDAHARVRRFALDGAPLEDLELPGLGSLSSFSGRAQDDVAYVAYTDFTTPWTVYRHPVGSDELGVVNPVRSGLDPNDFETRQVFYESLDGTRVPMTIVSPKGREAGEPGPLVLYGYGGFNVSLLPRYSVSRAAWLQAGGSYAVANIRGGGEYGEAWHRAGTRLNKQNAFDDFIAAAEWLIDAGHTSPGELAIWGGSNGGLLVAAVAQQRPDLFAAVVPAVGVLDMLRYHLPSANARQWSSDYGLSEVEEEFRVLYDYSPYHNLKKGRCYPATLVMADANDDRVMPWHSYKYAAALQHAQGCGEPVLIRVETQTGHGAGAATSKIIAEYADQWAFVAARTGLEPR